MKQRRNLYLDLDVCNALDVLARQQRTTASSLANAMLRDSHERITNGKADFQYKVRLDRMSAAIMRTERIVAVLFEAQMFAVRHLLTFVPPDRDKDKIAQGAARFEAFVDEIGRNIAAGGSSAELAQTAEGAEA